jgi:hypothetical protein
MQDSMAMMRKMSKPMKLQQQQQAMEALPAK